MRNILVLSFLLLVSFVGAQSAEAATLYFDPPTAELYPGDTVTLALRINTDEGECINVVDGTIELSENVMPVDVALGNSILPLWVEQPTINKGENTITFAGGIPNGYCGRIAGDPRLTNVLFEIVLQTRGGGVSAALEDPVAYVALAPETQIFLNNNEGTQAPLRTVPAELTVGLQPRDQIENAWRDRVDQDQTPPSQFSIILSSDPSIFAGRYFVAFNTTDKQSGIDHYEIMEEPIERLGLFDWGRADAPWKQARSPYLLKDQTLNSTIRVRAVDKAGNEYIAVYVPPEDTRLDQPLALIWVMVGALGVMILVTLLAGLFYVRRTKQYEDREEDLDEHLYE